MQMVFFYIYLKNRHFFPNYRYCAREEKSVLLHRNLE